MGVAVAVDDGLIVPVVRDVDQLSISGLNRAISEVAGRARAGKLRLEDYGGSTFTIDNTGWFGSNLTMPIINVPEVAILTMEAITKRAVVLETPDGDVIAIRPVMNMVLAIDHRANDGAEAAAFLRTIKNWLEAIGPGHACLLRLARRPRSGPPRSSSPAPPGSSAAASRGSFAPGATTSSRSSAIPRQARPQTCADWARASCRAISPPNPSSARS